VGLEAVGRVRSLVPGDTQDASRDLKSPTDGQVDIVHLFVHGNIVVGQNGGRRAGSIDHHANTDDAHDVLLRADDKKADREDSRIVFLRRGAIRCSGVGLRRRAAEEDGGREEEVKSVCHSLSAIWRLHLHPYYRHLLL
jgi:hypothetical protein